MWNSLFSLRRLAVGVVLLGVVLTGLLGWIAILTLRLSITHWLLSITHWLLSVSHRLLTVTHRLLTVAHWLLLLWWHSISAHGWLLLIHIHGRGWLTTGRGTTTTGHVLHGLILLHISSHLEIVNGLLKLNKSVIQLSVELVALFQHSLKLALSNDSVI